MIPRAEIALAKQNPEWTQDQIDQEIDRLTEKVRERVRADTQQAIDALYALRDYRLQGVNEWLETQGTT